MMRKAWHWDINLTESKIKRILEREDDPRFSRIAGTLLSRVDDPQEVFKLIAPVAFCRRWRSIENEIKSDEWTKEKAAFWKTTYLKLSKELQAKGERIRKTERIPLDPVTRDLIERIKQIRREAMFTQKELAELMGYSQQYISGIEKGREKISLDFLKKFSEITRQPFESFNFQSSEDLMKSIIKSDILQTPIQERIYQNLLLIGRGPADFYWDACQLMNERGPLRTQTHLISHLLREIESALRAVLIFSLKLSVDSSVNPKEQHKAEINAILQALKFSGNDGISEIWMSMAGKNNEKSFAVLAHRERLGPPRPSDQDFKKFWDDFEWILDEVLKRFRKRFLIHLDILDELAVKDDPGQKDLQKLLNNTPNNPISLKYFLDRCQSPKWLKLLAGDSSFWNPPPVTQEIDGARLAGWPQAGYLVRMAEISPDTVCRIMCAIPQTDHFWIHAELADAALKMPAGIASIWVKKEIDWVSRQSVFPAFLPEKLGLLISHLAKGGQNSMAMDLAEKLLTLSLDPEWADQADENFSLISPEPKIAFDRWDYENILEKNIPDLVKACGLPALELLCRLLNDAIALSRRRSNDNGPEDYSYVWRRSIGPDLGDDSRQIENGLVSAVRDAAETLINIKVASIHDIVSMLENQRWKVFRRIALYVLKVFGEQAPELAAAHLTDKSSFEDRGLGCEYPRLLSAYFSLLSSNQQGIIFQWIEEGPDIGSFGDFYQRNNGRLPSPEDEKEYKKYWQRDRLAWFKDRLSGKWKEFYESLVEELGRPHNAEYPFHMETLWTGPESPINPDEISRKSLPELMDFLKTWRPQEGPRESSVEGLGRILQDVVKNESQRFAEEAELFKDVHPTYVRSLIAGLTDAFEQNGRMPYEPVLNLCHWVVHQPREINGLLPEFTKDCDLDWGWTRAAVARFLAGGLEKDIFRIDHRKMVWEILIILTEDPDPSSDDKSVYRDPLTASINSVRGEAMHTVIRYALWVCRHIKKFPDAQEKLTKGFDEMKEVRDVLEKHLDVKNDASLAVRAVYGVRLPQLAVIDPQWTRSHVSDIFPAVKSMRSYHDAAWDTYIVYCDVYNNVFSILKKQYERAIESLAGNEFQGGWEDRPGQRLAEHLMILYWQGFFKIDSGNMFKKFWDLAPETLKVHAVGFIGRCLEKTTDEIPKDVLRRLKDLWEYRLKSGSPVEQKEFGWWFISGKLDDEWAMVQLKRVLEGPVQIEPDSLVVERLVKLVGIFPEEVLESLALIIQGDSKGWGYYAWKNSAKSILRQALQADAASKAKDVIDLLVSYGYMEFKELLEEKSISELNKESV